MHKLKPLLRYFRPYRRQVAGGMLAMVASASIGLVAPLLVGAAVDVLREEVTRDALLRYGGLLLAVTAFQGIFQFTQRLVLVTVSRRIEYDLGNDFFRHLEALHPAFYQEKATGDLMARATNDLAAVRMVCGPAIMYTTNMLVTSTGALILMVGIHPRLTLLALLPLPFVALATRFLGRRIHVLFEDVQRDFSQISAKVQENLVGARVVRAYAQEARENELFEALDRRYVDANRRLIFWNAAIQPVIFGLIGLSGAAILWYGGHLMLAGNLTVGEFVTFNMFLGKMIWPMISIGWVVNLAERAAASFGRMHAILKTPPEIRDEDDVVEVDEIRGAIALRDLRFYYGDETKPVLDGLDLEVEAGTTVALVGRTGTGKSTLLSLVPRLFDPPRESLYVDGIDARRLPLQKLRGAIAMVPQESFLFSDTIKKNIAFGRPGADAAEIREAASLAGLDRDLESLPRGLDTMVGERGITLSGGQKQRVALARAILRQAQILLLDDCLSAVDTETEREILENLRTVFPGRTVFQVSHRVSAVSRADLILVLEGGRIAERGSHEELLAHGGIYADLSLRQTLEEELAAV